MFGQSISGNVDMDGNGYAGPVRAEMEILLFVSLPRLLSSAAAMAQQTRDGGILLTAFQS